MPGMGQLVSDAVAIMLGLFGIGVLLGFLLGRWTAPKP